MAHPLDGVQAKLDRAFALAESIRQEIRALDIKEYYATTDRRRPKPDKRGRVWLDGYLRVLKEPPAKLGILAGDWAHNLRGSLDHLVYQLGVLNGPGRPSDTTFFPIAKSEAEYNTLGLCKTASLRDRALAGIKESHRVLIDAEQPFVGRTRQEADEHFLSVLNAFTNTDKHRIINPAAVRPWRVEAFPVAGQVKIEVVLPPKRPEVIGDGALVYSLGLSQVADEIVQVKANVIFAIGFGNRGLTDADMLNMCVDDVGKLIDRFRPLWM